MNHIMTSEWTKLRRPAMVAALAATIGVTMLGAVITLATATSTVASGQGSRPGPGGAAVTRAALERTHGLATALTQSSTLLGVVALAVAASAVASEYSLGTLRNLLVAEPRRARLLLGKLLALAVAVAAATIVAAGFGAGAAVIMANARGIDATAWATGAGAWATIGAVANLVVANVGWAAFGAVLAVAFRSPVAAIGVGIAYALPLESILGAISGTWSTWLPGKVIAAVASGGTDAIGYPTSLARLVVYVGLGIGLATIAFVRRDVTA